MRLFVRLILPLVLLTTLSACGSDDDSPGAAQNSPTPSPTPTPFRGLPDGVKGSLDSGAGVVAGEDAATIYVVTYGSGSNPAVVRQVSAEGQTVTVQVSAEDGKIQTMDFVPTTSTITLPNTVDTDQPITFVLGDFGSVTLSSTAPGTEAWVEPSE